MHGHMLLLKQFLNKIADHVDCLKEADSDLSRAVFGQ